MNGTQPHAIVIGGSVGGLAAAGLFRSIGWRASVFERAVGDLTGRDYLVAAGTRESAITAVGRSAVDTAQSGDVGSAILRRAITFTVRPKDGS